MKFLAAFCVLSDVLLDAASSQGVPHVLERTCDLPQRPNDYGACDIPDCFCNTGTVRHSGSGKCVHPKDCYFGNI